VAGGVEQSRVTTDGIRLDKWLAGLPSVGSRQKARDTLERGKVSIDGAAMTPADGGRVLAEGTVVSIAWNRPGTGEKRTAGRVALERAGVVVRHQDDAIVVVEKPPGLLTDAADLEQARFRDTLRKRVKAYLSVEDVWPAHRIDRDTSGLVLFARTPEVREHLLQQWHTQSPLREYLVVVEGKFPKQKGEFSDWMVWDPKQRIQRSCSPETPNAWLAQASFRVQEHFGEKATLLVVRLVTGRRNQIRLHCQLANHALVGEPLYRRREGGVEFERQALHATRLGFVHPATNQPVVFESPPPADLAGLLARLRTDRDAQRRPGR